MLAGSLWPSEGLVCVLRIVDLIQQRILVGEVWLMGHTDIRVLSEGDRVAS